MRRLAKLSLIMTVGLVSAALAACGPASTAAEPQLDLAASVEAEALAAMGIDPADLVVAEPAMAGLSESEAADGDETDKQKRLKNWRKRHALKVLLRSNVLHGEAVVETKKGPVTVLVQRGEITAIDDTSITVKSSDGHTQTWVFGEKLRVVEKRRTVQPEQLAVGAQIALAGGRQDDIVYARLIIVSVQE